MIADERELTAELLADEPGRLLFGLLMRETGVLAPAAMDSPYATYVREGERNVGLRIFNLALAAGGDPVACMKECADWIEARARLKEEKDFGADE